MAIGKFEVDYMHIDYEFALVEIGWPMSVRVNPVPERDEIVVTRWRNCTGNPLRKAKI